MPPSYRPGRAFAQVRAARIRAGPAVLLPVVPGLGIIEVVLGLAVAVGAFPRVVLLVLVGHLVGTFLTFVTATHLMFQAGNPLELSANGEFVVKNLVLISAALLLIASHGRRTADRAAA